MLYQGPIFLIFKGFLIFQWFWCSLIFLVCLDFRELSMCFDDCYGFRWICMGFALFPWKCIYWKIIEATIQNLSKTSPKTYQASIQRALNTSIYVYIYAHLPRFTWGDYESPHVNTPSSLIYMGRLRIPPSKSEEDIQI